MKTGARRLSCRSVPWALFAAAALAACGGGAVREDAPAGAPPAWQTEVYADHPLVGTIWLPGEGRRATPDELVERLVAQDLVLLGERHDNADHHALQAWTVARLVEAGRRPALVLEMLSADQAAALETWRATQPTTAEGLGAAVGWEDSGWPDWSLYAPIAERVVAARLPVLAANLGHGAVFRLAREGLAALSDEERRRAALDAPLPTELQTDLEAELVAGHCGHAAPAMLAGLAAVQRARDGSFARTLLDGAAGPGADGAVLIAGNGHTRRDRGVPWYLARLAPDRRVATVAFLEVVAGWTTPADYAAAFGGDLPYDAVWFTPRVDDVDPCEEFREQLERMQRHHGRE